jgi:hypothetical protein
MSLCTEWYKLFYKLFYNMYDILQYAPIKVTIQHFMTLYILSPDDGSVRTETCCVAL